MKKTAKTIWAVITISLWLIDWTLIVLTILVENGYLRNTIDTTTAIEWVYLTLLITVLLIPISLVLICKKIFLNKTLKKMMIVILLSSLFHLTLTILLEMGAFESDDPAEPARTEVMSVRNGRHERKVYDKVKSNSVLNLVGDLENFVSLQIESCDYEVYSEVIRSGIPAPSDTKVIIKGSAILSERGMQAFRDNYSFEDVDHANLPTELMPLLPNENLIYSKEFNETFSKNPWLWDGFVVLIKGDTTNKIFFITCDNNHGLEFNTQ